jgi:hemerythrin-like domain-containing protein
MTDFIQVLRQEHRNIESLLRVLERELTLFDRGERPDYEVVLAIIDYFRDYPEEDMIVEKIKARDPVATATIGNLEAEHGEGTRRLRRVAEAQKGHRRNSSTRSSSLSAAIPVLAVPA